MTIKENRAFWFTIIIGIFILFLLQLFFHKDFIFDHCICEDGTFSFSVGKGSCSWHGGIKNKVYFETMTTYTFIDIFIFFINSVLIGPFFGIVLSIIIRMFKNRNI